MTDQTVRECQRCKFQLSNGRRCSRNTCLYSSYCWQHGRKKKGLSVKDSRIQGAGKGLFAARDLPRGYLIPYKGVHMTRREIDRLYPGDMTAQYVYCVNSRHCYDAKSTQSGYGRWANHSQRPNAEWYIQRRRGQAPKVFLRLLQDLAKDTEITIDYGDEYWGP